MIYVTHDQVEAMTMGDRIVVLYAGEIQQIGSPSELYDQPANKFVAGFIGTPTINYFEGEIQGKTINLQIGQIELDNSQADFLVKNLESNKLIIGIRPEDISLGSDLNASHSFKAKIDVVEPLGSVTHVYLRTEAEEHVTTSVNGLFIKNIDDEVVLSYDKKKVHVFDAVSEKSVLHGL
jgi:multiple sugar transport system ATP-binding protein